MLNMWSIHKVYIIALIEQCCIQIVYISFKQLEEILLDVYLMYTKYIHQGSVVQIVYTLCIQKVY